MPWGFSTFAFSTPKEVCDKLYTDSTQQIYHSATSV